jgi:hypothetical protein
MAFMRIPFPHFLVCLLGAAALHAAPTQAQPKPDTALLPVYSDAVGEVEAELLGLLARQNLEARGGLILQSRQETALFLSQAEEVGQSCDPQKTSCLVRMGNLLGVKNVVHINVPKAEDNEVIVEASLIDVAGVRLKQRVQDSLPRKDPERSDALNKLLDRLLSATGEGEAIDAGEEDTEVEPLTLNVTVAPVSPLVWGGIGSAAGGLVLFGAGALVVFLAGDVARPTASAINEQGAGALFVQALLVEIAAYTLYTLGAGALVAGGVLITMGLMEE